MIDNAQMPLMTRLVALFLRGDVSILLVIMSLLLGAAALTLTPREEEPQIVVPLADVMISAPGLSAEETERKVTERLEKLVSQIDGVEYVYSMSRPGEAVVTVRFFVGENREDSIVKLYNKLHSNLDRVPTDVAAWVVKPVEIDDVPIVTVALWSEQVDRHGDFELRRIAEQLQQQLQAIRNTNRVDVIGGRPRQIRIELDATQLAARQTAPLDVAAALRAANVHVAAGAFQQRDREMIVEAGTFIADADELANLVIHVADDRPVYLRDVARVIDGPAEAEQYSWMGFGPAETEHVGDDAEAGQVYPAVHLAVAKRKGANAVWVADAVHQRMEQLAESHLPDGVHWRVTRDYGETANEKVNELVEGLAIAVLTVVVLIGLALGWRAALVIAIAIPVCYSLTLFVNLLAGYSINRVTMFALILSLGLLVDDPITDVENIARYFTMRIKPPRESVLIAVQEVRPALILSTLAIIISFLPLVFITGMMGPYMAPMALNVPLTVGISTIVAFLVTPWLAMVALRRLIERPAGHAEAGFDITRRPLYRIFRALLGPMLDRRWMTWTGLAIVAVLMAAAMSVPMFRLVPLKMLPYDNKNEFLVVVDMPEGTTLERTDAAARELGRFLSGVAEVRDFQVYVGGGAPMDFNGMVRHYYLRRGSHVADIRVNLVDKDHRQQQSHAMLLRIRRQIDELAAALGANVKLVEVPPGPPVLATITAEVYGPAGGDYGELLDAAETVAERLQAEPLVVDVDTTAEADQVRWEFQTDKAKAALSGITTENVAQTLQLALAGHRATVLHDPTEVNPLAIELRLPRSHRSAIEELNDLYVRGDDDQIVQIGQLGEFQQRTVDKTIYHKNLRRVAFVYAEVAGRPPAEAIVDIQLDRDAGDGAVPFRQPDQRTWLAPGGGQPWSLPDGFEVHWAGEGEWKITLDVFRDLGIAFGVAQVGIFILLMFQTRSLVLPLVIMLAIPLTVIGIMPGFWLLNAVSGQSVGGYPDPVFFTATAMIGMIALSGIVVRNSVVLIDFIHHGLDEGLAMREAIIRSAAVRTRPILLTAGTTLLGNWVITLDPIFSGLAWSIIFGILTSTLFTLIVIPLVYWLLYGNTRRSGTPVPDTP